MIISCGKCDKFFWYYVLAYYIFAFIIVGCHHTFPNIKEKRTKDFLLLNPTLTYLGEFLMIFYGLIYNKINRSEKNALINNKEKNKMTKKGYIYFGIVCFLLLLSDFFKLLFLFYLKKYSFQGYFSLNKSWTFVLLFLILFNAFYFKKNVYRHQKLAIFFFILSGVTSLLVGIIVNLEDKFVARDLVPIIFQTLSIIFEAIIIILIKKIMDKNFISPLKVCYLIGLFNFIISSISLFILSNIKNKSEYIFSFSFVKEEKIFGIIILFIVYPLINGIRKLMINIILNKYTMFHLFIFFKFDSLIDSSKIDYKANITITIKIFFFIQMILQLIELCMYFVYLEMIELNFCGLSKNIKKNIQNRASNEFSEIEEEINNLEVNFDLDGGFTSSFNEKNDEEKKIELNSQN